MYQLKNSSFAATLLGILAGYFFGFWVGASCAIITLLALAYFYIRPALKKESQVENTDGKPIGHSGSANHFMNGEAVGGQLFLFDSRLEFKSHSANFQEHAKIIDIKNIKELVFYNTIGIVPNGLAIITTDGKKEKFVVNKRKTWKQQIEKAMSPYQKA